ncbi:hypothetical protein OAI47_02510 [Rhodospirillaceae bacterium]|nr:hypothetical protein [Rhodospirillaceae bacterium]
MKIGLFLTNQQFTTTDMVKALDEQIQMVHHARDNGWNTLLSGQHYLNEGNNQQLQLVPFFKSLNTGSRRHAYCSWYSAFESTQSGLHSRNSSQS